MDEDDTKHNSNGSHTLQDDGKVKKRAYHRKYNNSTIKKS